MAQRRWTFRRSPSSRVSRHWLSLRDLGPAHPTPAPRVSAVPVACPAAASHQVFWGPVVARRLPQRRRARPRRGHPDTRREGQARLPVEVHSLGGVAEKNLRVRDRLSEMPVAAAPHRLDQQGRHRQEDPHGDAPAGGGAPAEVPRRRCRRFIRRGRRLGRWVVAAMTGRTDRDPGGSVLE
jgi:hypothetical protein